MKAEQETARCEVPAKKALAQISGSHVDTLLRHMHCGAAAHRRPAAGRNDI